MAARDSLRARDAAPTAWVPWVWARLRWPRSWMWLLQSWWDGFAALWEEEVPAPAQRLTAAQLGPPPATTSLGNVVITGNVCVSPRPHASLSTEPLSTANATTLGTAVGGKAATPAAGL